MSSPWPAAAAVLALPAAGLWTAAAWQKSALRAARRMSSGGDVRVAIFVGWLAEWLDAMVPGVFIVVWPLVPVVIIYVVSISTPERSWLLSSIYL